MLGAGAGRNADMLRCDDRRIRDKQVGDREEHRPCEEEQPAKQQGKPQPDASAAHDAGGATILLDRCPSVAHRSRYPAPATVSISPGSPSLPRSRRTVTLTVVVNGSAC